MLLILNTLDSHKVSIGTVGNVQYLKEVARQILVDCEKDGFAEYKWSYDESTDTFAYTDTLGELYEDCQGFKIMVDG